MKKLLCVLLAVALLPGHAWGEGAPAARDRQDREELRVIPYPPGTDTTTEGASSAPESINHRASIYFDTMTDYFYLAPKAHVGARQRRVLLPRYPTYQQTRENTCGPAAGLTVLYYYGETGYTEASLAVEMKTRPYPIGTNPKDMLAFFERLGWETDSSLTRPRFDDYAAFQQFAWENLQKGIPIMVENVEWGGHWRVIIGYDTMGTETTLDDVLIMADPYDTCDHKQDGYVVNNGEKFYAMWFDHSMLPEDQREQPWITAHPK